MVLHLLGKKSWNVYNTANVERVRRDEAEARAREQAEEQTLQAQDAAYRIAVLRGDSPAAAAAAAPAPAPAVHLSSTAPSQSDAISKAEPPLGRPHDDSHSRARKRRRLHEDDTDRDLRHAREHAEAGEKAARRVGESGHRDAALQDDAGHVQLFPAPDEGSVRKAEKNADAEAEKASKKRRDEDQYTMRFSNAAGFQVGLSKPWYAAKGDSSDPSASDMALARTQDKNAWGYEDPRRKEREQKRITSSDPFAAMQQAQRQLKQSERDREAYQQQQRAEIEDLNRDVRARETRPSRRRPRDDDADCLEGFSIDAPTETKHQRMSDERVRERRHHHDHHHRRKHRHRSPSPSPGRSRRHGHQEER